MIMQGDTFSLRSSVEPERSRLINLDGAVNMRDVGGLQTVCGHRLRRGRLLRSAALLHLTTDSAKQLIERFGKFTILDLRTPTEIVREGSPNNLADAGANILKSPVSDAGFLGGVMRPTSQDYVSSYVRLIPSALQATALAVSHMALEGSSPLVISCTAGKDRTGIVIAMLLSYLHVHERVIAEDYALSARQLRPHLSLFHHHWKKRGLTAAQYSIRLQPQKVTMHSFLKQLYLPGSGYDRQKLHSPLTSSTDAQLLDSFRSSMIESGEYFQPVM